MVMGFLRTERGMLDDDFGIPVGTTRFYRRRNPGFFDLHLVVGSLEIAGEFGVMVASSGFEDTCLELIFASSLRR